MSTAARTTGWAAIAYVVLYLLTFVTNALMSALGPGSDIEYRSPEQMMADLPSGIVFGVSFALIGTALTVVALGLRRVVWDDESIAGTATSSVGAIAGAGLMLGGAAAAAQRGFAANDLAGTGADPATQLAVVQAGFLLTNTGFFLASLAILVWLSSVAIAARRYRTLPPPLILGTWLTALAPIVSIALTGFASGLLVTIPYAAALGIVLLRRVRQHEASVRTSTPEPSSA